jgi:hypothetical protein
MFPTAPGPWVCALIFFAICCPSHCKICQLLWQTCRSFRKVFGRYKMHWKEPKTPALHLANLRATKAARAAFVPRCQDRMIGIWSEYGHYVNAENVMWCFICQQGLSIWFASSAWDQNSASIARSIIVKSLTWHYWDFLSMSEELIEVWEHQNQNMGPKACFLCNAKNILASKSIWRCWHTTCSGRSLIADRRMFCVWSLRLTSNDKWPHLTMTSFRS